MRVCVCGEGKRLGGVQSFTLISVGRTLSAIIRGILPVLFAANGLRDAFVQPTSHTSVECTSPSSIFRFICGIMSPGGGPGVRVGGLFMVSARAIPRSGGYNIIIL